MRKDLGLIDGNLLELFKQKKASRKLPPKLKP
jgi:hypothetical protein